MNLPANSDIAEIYRIRNYPSLHLFIDNDDEHYSGRLYKEYLNS